MEELNCLGDFCPVPALKVQAQLARLLTGESLTVITDHSCALDNIKAIITDEIISMEVNEVANGIWEMILVKK